MKEVQEQVDTTIAMPSGLLGHGPPSEGAGPVLRDVLSRLLGEVGGDRVGEALQVVSAECADAESSEVVEWLRSLAPPVSERAVDGAMTVVKEAWEENYRCFGVDKLWRVLRSKGHGIGRQRVANVMHELGLSGVASPPAKVSVWVKAKKTGRSVPNVWSGPARMLPTQATDQRWWIEVTAALAGYEGAQVVLVVDAFSKRILASAVTRACGTRLLKDLIAEALATRNGGSPANRVAAIVKPPLAGFVTDLDDSAFEDWLGADYRRSVSRARRTVLSAYHLEMTAGFNLPAVDLASLRERTRHWGHWYNAVRPHGGLGNSTPVRFEAEMNSRRPEDT